MSTHGISVVIAHVPARAALLGDALKSVYEQERPAAEVCVAADHQRLGAAATRQTALEMAGEEWVAFLDDDDMFYPQHLERLLGCALDTQADYVFSYFDRAKGGDPLGHFGKVFNPAVPTQTTITTLVRRELAMEAGFKEFEDRGETWSGEDWRFLLRCIDLKAKIVHHPEETWLWRRYDGNSSGLPGRGNAPK